MLMWHTGCNERQWSSHCNVRSTDIRLRFSVTQEGTSSGRLAHKSGLHALTTSMYFAGPTCLPMNTLARQKEKLRSCPKVKMLKKSTTQQLLDLLFAYRAVDCTLVIK